MPNTLHTFARRNVKRFSIFLCAFVLFLFFAKSDWSYWINYSWQNNKSYMGRFAHSQKSHNVTCAPRHAMMNIDLNETAATNYSNKEAYSFNTTKLILDWTGLYRERLEDECYLKECPHYNCEITNDRSRLSEADAVAFHPANLDLNDLPQKRKPEQYFLYHTLESPRYTWIDLTSLDSYFNITLTYRNGSDFYYPYGSVHRRPFPINGTRLASEIAEIASNKTKLVSWFVSHCRMASRRELYVQLLTSYVQVDIYGECGALKCPRYSAACDSMIESDYKFYLSFENSLCMEYVTEKLFKRLKQVIVPVVLTKRFYQNIYLPPKSVIAVDEFCTIEDLANYLLYLDGNMTAYLEYFQWKYEYEVMDDFMCLDMENCGFCGFCSVHHRPSPINGTRLASGIAEIASNKTKLVTWFVSHCGMPSKRDLYVQTLNAYVQVDIYGKCGALKCPLNSASCDSMVERDYKFYLSFENNLCMEYATEKLFKRLKQVIVPVVLTRRFYRNIYLPPKSIIAVDEFCTIEDLANYLLYLDKNMTAYLEYFQWKNEYEVMDDFRCLDMESCGFCGFCRLLHKQERPQKIFRNIQKWWFTDAPCDNNIVLQLLAGQTRKTDAFIDGQDGRPTCYSSSNWP